MKKLNFKTWLMVFAISLFANNLFAQGAYVNLNLGYGFSMSSQNLPGFYKHTTNGGGSYTNEQVNVSLGKGLNFGGAFGYMFNENVGAELGISYLIGGQSKETDTYNDGKTDFTISSNMLRINPSLVIAAGFEKINPYAKFGLVLGAGSINFESNDIDNGNVTIQKAKYNGGMALGLSSAIGVLFGLSDNLSLFAELNMMNLSYAPTKGVLTEATYNGIDQLPNMTTKDKEIEFVDSYTYDPGNPPPDSQPSKELKQKYPYGDLGVNIGVRIGF